MKCLYGTVTIRRTYPVEAKKAIVYVCSKWYDASEGYVSSMHSYHIPQEHENILQEYFCGTTYQEDIIKLKLRLRALGVYIPPLIRQY